MKYDFTIYFRTGGIENFRWNRSCAMTRNEAIARHAELLTAGYAAHYCKTSLLDKIGLPDTFDGYAN